MEQDEVEEPENKAKKNKDGSKQDWRCERYQDAATGGCKAWLQTLVAGNDFISFKSHDPFQGHNHALDPMAVPSAPVSLGPSLPSSAVRKMIRRVRVKNSIPVVEGANVQNINIPIDCQRYVDADGNEEMFLLGDSGTDDAQRILIFGRQKHIEWSHEIYVVYMDGSFRITPAPYYQAGFEVYAILAERTTTTVENGCFRSFMHFFSTKARKTYKKLFGMIKEMWPAFNPSSISVDFEQAAIQALIQAFPRLIFFGFYQSLPYVRIKDRRLSISSREKFQEEDFCVRSLSALQQSRVLSQSKDDCFAGICSASQGLGIV
uniref:MULE transposase domain-containing protein n=1 Tax=Ditylenchus dipsaci TaxID=166011 RepID=A0A915CSV9_9BILA